ncbi:MAG: hypothetical protein ACE14V_04645 [bacterium]
MKRMIVLLSIIIIIGLGIYVGYWKSVSSKPKVTEKIDVNPPNRSQPHNLEVELAYLKEQSRIPANIDKAMVIRLMPEAINNFETALQGVNSQDTISKADWPAAKEIALKIHDTGMLPPGAYLQVMEFRSGYSRFGSPRLDLVFPTEKNKDPGFILPLIEIETLKAYTFK